MRSRIHYLAMALIAIATMTLITVCGTNTARAQLCSGTTLTIINNSTCAVAPCLTRLAFAPLCFAAVAPGATVFTPLPPGAQHFTGVRTAGGTNIAWVGTIPFDPNRPLVVACFRSLPSNCCIDIFYNPATCTIEIFNSGCPPHLCQP